MNKLLYSTKDLFSVTGNNALLLSTVCLQPTKDLSKATESIKELYPEVYSDYTITTELYRKKKILASLLGKCYWFGYPDCKQRVALIYVSKKFGRWQDPLVAITKNTIRGLDQLLTNLPPTIEVHCTKLNLSSFNVPWNITEKEINKLLQKHPKHRVIVHD